ncbi:DUF6771 family protein [Sphingomonas japonica]|uniref:Uncharacterized protein n=1 Tax=Sphingomonas japonica TaxID=511662 RepID=A0ABX0TX29_9SPHN|nr:DUF6771 family protein [Sphingomonas japonica]NIJ22861.1 hypothetical protein [Sphingomonas japonica]
MMTDTRELIALAIDNAPAWAKLALTVPSPRLREDGQRELARHVYVALTSPAPADPNQMVLPL